MGDLVLALDAVTVWAGLLAIVALGAAVWYLQRRRRKQKGEPKDAGGIL